MSQCACVRLKKKPVINEDEELSDSSKSDIAMATTPCLKPKPKPKRRLSFKIGDLRRIVPDKILQCFGQDEIEMTKLEKSKFEPFRRLSRNPLNRLLTPLPKKDYIDWACKQ